MLKGSGGPIKGPVRGPRPVVRGKRSGMVAALLAASATFSLFLIAGLVWGWSVYYAPGPSARAGEATIVSLSSGSGVSAIAAQLKNAGVIRSTDMFKAAATLTGADRKLRAGEYQVPTRASLRSVLRLLTDGRVVRHYVTIPEGWSSAQAVDILNRETVLTGTVETPPAEGSLWPDTYEVARGETRAAVVARMQRAMTENLAKLWAARGQGLVVRTPEEAVTLASVVEKETGLAAERPRVAAVFSNRLRMGIRLESDPTIVYGITHGRPLGRGIRQSELQADTGYNTYLIDGLPPSLEELRRRLVTRSQDAEDVIERRIRNAKGEIEHSDAFDYVFVNDDFDRSYAELAHIYHAERSRRFRNVWVEAYRDELLKEDV
jgi:UPF0755 protein